MRSPSHVSVAELADRYLAEQCARLGPIDGTPAPAQKRSASRTATLKMDASAGSKAMARATFRAQRMGGHDGAGTNVGTVDRFRP